MVLDLERRDQLVPLTERARIRREGGYAGFDVLLFFVFFFAGGVSKGVRTYWEDDARFFGGQLAAVGGRKRLASPASLSRALSAVEFEDTRTFGPWLLREVAGTEGVMRHPAAMTWDAISQPWHVFDFDPTVHTLRQRALPAGDDLPKTIRRCVELAPGYSGRKRGDTQLHRSTLQHTGSSVWLDLQVAPGNGDTRAELGHALDVVAETVDALGAPRERALVRADGAFGHVPGITAARERGLAFLSRLTRPNLLDKPVVRRRLAESTWLYVPDSGSGPRRSAMDVGMVTLPPGEATVRADGSSYAPVEVRVVVSRYPCGEESRRGRGRVIDGWRYELYVADGLAANAWPAHEVVAQYYGRTSEENRFHQEDRELNLDRVFSYHLPGQEFVTLVGLFVWNLRVALGFELEPPPEPVRSSTRQEVEFDVRVVAVEVAEEEEASMASLGESAATKQSLEPTADTPTTTAVHPLEHALSVTLDTFDWEQSLARRPGWGRVPETMTVMCPQDQPLSLICVSNPSRDPTRSRLFFQSTFGSCCGCVSMADCFPSALPNKAKRIAFTVSLEDGAMVQTALRPVQRLRRSSPRKSKPVPLESDTHERNPAPPPVSIAVRHLDPELLPGNNAIVDPLLLPAAARRIFYQATRRIDITVTVGLPAPPIPHPRLLARSKADRQHRRCTWDQHRDRYALPAEARVSVRLDGGSALARIVGEPPKHQHRIAR